MIEYLPGRCDMCLKDAYVRHVNIYINGSEGTFLCHSCYMELVEIVRERKRASFKKKMDAYKASRKKKMLEHVHNQKKNRSSKP